MKLRSILLPISLPGGVPASISSQEQLAQPSGFSDPQLRDPGSAVVAFVASSFSLDSGLKIRRLAAKYCAKTGLSQQILLVLAKKVERRGASQLATLSQVALYLNRCTRLNRHISRGLSLGLCDAFISPVWSYAL